MFTAGLAYTMTVKIDFYRNGITRITGSSVFKTPDVVLTVLATLVNKLETDYLAAQSGLYEAKADMHRSKTAADDKFRLIANYVDRIANGNESTILSAGFNPSRQPGSPKKRWRVVIIRVK